MSSNMSRRRRDVPPVEPPDEDDPEDFEPDEEVEYLVEADEEDCVRTSVPNSLQSSQSSSSAPSTFVVVSDARSAPHISHCGMDSPSPAPRIKGTGRRHQPTASHSLDVGPRAPEPLERGEVPDDGEDDEEPADDPERPH